MFFRFWRIDGNIQLGFRHLLGLLYCRNNCKNPGLLMHGSFESRAVLNRLQGSLTAHSSVKLRMKWVAINGKLASEVLCLRSPAFKHYGRILGYQHKVVCNCKHIQTFENAPPGNCFSPFDEVWIYNPSFKDEN